VSSRGPDNKRQLRGLTLIELLVAMVIGLIVVLAAVASLTVARRGFSTVDAASQLRDSSRFAADLIGRVSVQAGYRDLFIAASATSIDPLRMPNVSGFNNAFIDATNPLTAFTTRTAGVDGYGSDVLIVRYQAAQLYSMYEGSSLTNGSVSDQTMIDCAGNASATVPDPMSTNPASTVLVASIFHVAINQGEPALMCTYSDTGVAPFVTRPIVQGVENLQVLYGVDGVTAGTAPAATASPNVPLSYLRADQLVVAGNTAATYANWRRVRSLRIGMVLRSAPGSTQDPSSQSYFPFGAAKASATGATGSAFSSANDPGTTFTPTPDGRLRQTVTFTVHLRNDQGL
jgi:type IV pilus assembly protein PilW